MRRRRMVPLIISFATILCFVTFSRLSTCCAFTSNSSIRSIGSNSVRRRSISSSSSPLMMSRRNSNSNNNNVRTYDLVVIGGGSAGLTAAKLAATFDKSVVIIEQNRLGGDCTWTGCVPSKSLLASAKVAHVVRTSTEYGVSVPSTKPSSQQSQQQSQSQSSSPVVIDMVAIRDRIRRTMERIYDEDDSPEVMSKLGIHTLSGRATFVDPTTLRVMPVGSTVHDVGNNDNDKDQTTSTTTTTTTTTSFQSWTTVMAKDGIVVCTGAKPKQLSSNIVIIMDGLEQHNDDLRNKCYITYEDIFDLNVLPQQLTIIGGGPIGCELAQAFVRLGSQVTHVATKLLPKEEPEASETLERVFESEGIVRIRGRLTTVKSTTTNKGGGTTTSGRRHEATCTLQDGSTTTVSGDVLLVAVGRRPNVDNFGLRDIGVKMNDKGGIATNERLQTTVKNVYAAGDCTGDRQFTHYAGFQGAIAARNILLPLSDQGVIENVPSATFTSPEVSSIGLTEEAAKVQHGEKAVGVAFKRMSHVDRAICDGEEAGFIKIIYSKKNYRILGATVMSPAAGELISEIGVAMKAKLPFDQLATVIHSYPAYSIALQMMASDVNYEKTLKSKFLLDILKWIGL